MISFLTTETYNETQTTKDKFVNYDLTNIIYSGFQVGVWAVGTIGNSLSICIFSTKELRSSLTGFLFLCLAIVELIIIQENIYNYISKAFGVVHFDVAASSMFICKASRFIFVSGRLIAVWLLVGVAVERLICVVWPHRAKSICTLKRGKIFALILFVSVSLIDIPQILSARAVSIYSPRKEVYFRYCWTIYGPTYYILNIEPWISFSLYALLPSVILFIINITIITCLRKAAHRRKRYQQGGTGESQEGSTDAKLTGLTTMLVCVSSTFVILTLPFCIHMILSNFAGVNTDIVRRPFTVFLYMNHAINFILYCLSGARFRQKFIYIITCKHGKA